MGYGAPGSYATASLSDCQNGMGLKGALETVQNRYRNDPTIRDAAKEMSPREIMDMAKNPKEPGKLVTQSALGKQPSNAPTQEKQRANSVSAL